MAVSEYVVGSTYGNLLLHLQRWKYTRGQYKGDAPADRWKRGKSRFRVVDCGDHMAVRMYRTDILTAYPDGRIVIDKSGWDTKTTRVNLHYAIGQFVPFRVWIGSQVVMGLRQKVLVTPTRKVLYYDGVELDGEGTVISPLKPFARRRIHAGESKEFQQGLKDSGFRTLFPLLYQDVIAQPGDGYPRGVGDGAVLAECLTDADCADQWREVVRKYTGWPALYMGPRAAIDPKQVWAAIMAECKTDMYEIVPTDVYEL